MTNETEPNPNKFFKWTVEIEISEVWVADGFEITAERLQEMIQGAIGFSYESETRVRVHEIDVWGQARRFTALRKETMGDSLPPRPRRPLRCETG